MFVNDSSKNNKKALGWLASVVLHALVIILMLNINYLSGPIDKKKFTEINFVAELQVLEKKEPKKHIARTKREKEPIADTSRQEITRTPALVLGNQITPTQIKIEKPKRNSKKKQIKTQKLRKTTKSAFLTPPIPKSKPSPPVIEYVSAGATPYIDNDPSAEQQKTDIRSIEKQLISKKKNISDLNAKEPPLYSKNKRGPQTPSKSNSKKRILSQNISKKKEAKTSVSVASMSVVDKNMLLKTWGGAVRNSMVDRTRNLKLNESIKIALKINTNGNLMNIMILNKNDNEAVLQDLVKAIKTHGSFPKAPKKLKLDFVTFPVNLRANN